MKTIMPGDWKLVLAIVKYIPMSHEHEFEAELHRLKNQRHLTKAEAKELVARLTKRIEHSHHYCACENCEPNGATSHITSFPVKPKFATQEVGTGNVLGRV